MNFCKCNSLHPINIDRSSGITIMGINWVKGNKRNKFYLLKPCLQHSRYQLQYWDAMCYLVLQFIYRDISYKSEIMKSRILFLCPSPLPPLAPLPTTNPIPLLNSPFPLLLSPLPISLPLFPPLSLLPLSDPSLLLGYPPPLPPSPSVGLAA
jgi:hypothetical protein